MPCNAVCCSVSMLQAMIEKMCRIAKDKQVLLISGGENLNPSSRVCSYSAGTVSTVTFSLSVCTALLRSIVEVICKERRTRLTKKNREMRMFRSMDDGNSGSIFHAIEGRCDKHFEKIR